MIKKLITATYLGFFTSSFAISFISQNFEQLELSGTQYVEGVLIEDDFEWIISGGRKVSTEDAIETTSLGFGTNSILDRSLSLEIQDERIRRIRFDWKSYFTSGSASDRQIYLFANEELVFGEFLSDMDSTHSIDLDTLNLIPPTRLEWISGGSKQIQIDNIEIYLGEDLKERPRLEIINLTSDIDIQNQTIELKWESNQTPDRYFVFRKGILSKDPQDGIDIEQFPNIFDEFILSNGTMSKVQMPITQWGETLEFSIVPSNNFGEETLYQYEPENMAYAIELPEKKDLVEIYWPYPSEIHIVSDRKTYFTIQPNQLIPIVDQIRVIDSNDTLLVPEQSIADNLYIELPPRTHSLTFEFLGINDSEVILTKALKVHASPFELESLQEFILSLNSEFPFIKDALNPDDYKSLEGFSEDFFTVDGLKEWLKYSLLIWLLSKELPDPKTINEFELLKAETEFLSVDDWKLLLTNLSSRSESLYSKILELNSHSDANQWDLLIKTLFNVSMSPLEWVRTYNLYLNEKENLDLEENDILTKISFFLYDLNQTFPLFSNDFAYDDFIVKAYQISAVKLGIRNINLDITEPNDIFITLLKQYEFWEQKGKTPFAQTINNDGTHWNSIMGNYYFSEKNFPWIYTENLGWIYLHSSAYLAGFIYSPPLGWIPYDFGWSSIH